MVFSEMSRMPRKIDILGSPKLTLAFRVILGVTLLVFGAMKFSDISGFADAVVNYRILAPSLARVYGLALPWAEVVIGALLVSGLGQRWVAPVAILIIASFISATVANLYWYKTALQTCSCLGKVDWPLNTTHLAAQLIMLVMAAQIWLHKGELLSIDSILSRRGRTEG